MNLQRASTAALVGEQQAGYSRFISAARQSFLLPPNSSIGVRTEEQTVAAKDSCRTASKHRQQAKAIDGTASQPHVETPTIGKAPGVYAVLPIANDYKNGSGQCITITKCSVRPGEVQPHDSALVAEPVVVHRQAAVRDAVVEVAAAAVAALVAAEAAAAAPAAAAGLSPETAARAKAEAKVPAAAGAVEGTGMLAGTPLGAGGVVCMGIVEKEVGLAEGS